MKEVTAFYSVVVVFSKNKKQILLGKRRDDKKWTSPAGGGCPGESPEDAAIRELFEEANITCNKKQLKCVTSTMAGNGKPIFIYMLHLKEIQDIHPKNDPDKEVPSWKWFDLDKMPSLDKNRQETVNLARMKMGDLIKSVVSTDMFSGVDLNTQDFSQDDMASRDTYWHEILSNLTEDVELNSPVSTILEDEREINIIKIGEGLYSGNVKETSTGDKLINFNELSIASLVQMLKAKEFIGKEPMLQKENPVVEKLEELSEKISGPPEGDSDVKVEAPGIEGLGELIDKLKNIHVEGDLNIHIKKSLHDIVNTLYKGATPKRGKHGFPVGTKRTWSNGITAIKHPDGWVVAKGEHYGKLMGKFKEEALYKSFVEEHLEEINKGAAVEEKGKGDQKKPQDTKEGTRPVEEKETRGKESSKESRKDDGPKDSTGGQTDGSSNGPMENPVGKDGKSDVEGKAGRSEEKSVKKALNLVSLISAIKEMKSE